MTDIKKKIDAILESTEQDADTFTLYHGGRSLESDYLEVRGNKSGQIKYGVGLYLISDIRIAARYAKGGNKLYRVTCRKGNKDSDVIIPPDAAREYIKRLLGRASKNHPIWDWIERVEMRGNGIPAENLTNLVLNYELVKPAKTMAFRQFLIDHGVDYHVTHNFGGSRNTMVVLVNPRIIQKVEVIRWSDVPKEEYDLPVSL